MDRCASAASGARMFGGTAGLPQSASYSFFPQVSQHSLGGSRPPIVPPPRRASAAPSGGLGHSTPPPHSRSPVSTRLNYNSPAPRPDERLDFGNNSFAGSASFEMTSAVAATFVAPPPSQQQRHHHHHGRHTSTGGADENSDAMMMHAMTGTAACVGTPVARSQHGGGAARQILGALPIANLQQQPYHHCHNHSAADAHHSGAPRFNSHMLCLSATAPAAAVVPLHISLSAADPSFGMSNSGLTSPLLRNDTFAGFGSAGAMMGCSYPPPAHATTTVAGGNGGGADDSFQIYQPSTSSGASPDAPRMHPLTQPHEGDDGDEGDDADDCAAATFNSAGSSSSNNATLTNLANTMRHQQSSSITTATASATARDLFIPSSSGDSCMDGGYMYARRGTEAQLGATLPMNSVAPLPPLPSSSSLFADGYHAFSDDAPPSLSTDYQNTHSSSFYPPAHDGVDAMPTMTNATASDELTTPRIGHGYHGHRRESNGGGGIFKGRGRDGGGAAGRLLHLESPPPSVSFRLTTPATSISAAEHSRFAVCAAAMQTPQTSRVKSETRQFLDAELNSINVAYRTVAPPLVTQVTDNIFLGGFPVPETRAALRALGITQMINCCSDQNALCESDASGFDVFGIAARDEADYFILHYHFDAFRDAMDAIIARKERVFVHCVGGVNRSVCLVVAYMIKRLAYSPVEAVRRFRSQGRNVILDNNGFRTELVEHFLTCNPELEAGEM